MVANHLKKQLSEISPHISSVVTYGTPANYPTPRAYKYQGNSQAENSPSASTTKPWTTPELRQRFEQRWHYSTKLARWQYCEGLLDQRTYLKWSLDSLAGSSSFETMWLILSAVVKDYLDEYKQNRLLMHLLIETLAKATKAVSSHDAYAVIFLDFFADLLTSLLSIQAMLKMAIGFMAISIPTSNEYFK